MKIVYFGVDCCNPLVSKNGSEIFQYHMAEKLALLGNCVKLVSMPRKKHRFLTNSYFECIEYPPAYKRFFIDKKLKEDIQINKLKMDIAHLNAVYVPEMWSLSRLLVKLEIPYVVSTHGSLDPALMGRRGFPKNLYKYIFALRYLNDATFVHVHAEPEIEIAKKYGVRSHIFCINNGIDFSEVPEVFEKNWLRSKFNLNENIFLFVFFGRLDPYQKGLDLLFHAFAKFIKNPMDIKPALILIGPEKRGSLIYLKSLRDQLNLSSYIHFAGALWGRDKFNALADSDIYILPSRHEGFPLTLIEAMACGKASIVSAPTVRKFISDHQIGFICEPSVESIYLTMKKAIIKRSELPNMGERAKIIAQKEFNWTISAKKMMDAYNQVISGRGISNNNIFNDNKCLEKR